MDQPAKVANPARGQLNRENNIPLSPCVPENLVSRDGFSRPVPRQPAHLHTQAESGAYLRDSSRVPRRRPFMKTPYAIGSVPSLSGHAIAYRWRSLPRVRRHRASKPQGSSKRVLPWQITMDQLIFAVFFGLATNTLNVRNNNNSNNKLMYHKKCYVYFHGAQGVLLYHRKQTQNSPNQRAHRVSVVCHVPANIQATSAVECDLWYGVRRPYVALVFRCYQILKS